MSKTIVQVLDNAPIILKGDLELVDMEKEKL